MEGAASEHFETIYVDKPTVGCDGGKGSLGHPMVYLDVMKHGDATCPYCSRYYMFKKKSAA